MRFGDTPEFLQEADFSFRPLSYNHDKGVVTIGKSQQPINGFDSWDDRFFWSEPVAPEEYPDHPVLLGFTSRLVTTPKLFSWLTDDRTNVQAEFVRTASVMRHVFEELQATTFDEEFNEMSIFGFSAGFVRKGHINLSVLGSCACLHTDPDGLLVGHNEWETGYTELVFHNIDTLIQRTSLIAGLGHLALRCEESVHELHLF